MSEEEPREVGKILPRSKAKSRSLTASEMKSRVKIAMTTSGTQMGSGGNFYSPELSTDFLELPQSQDEQRNYFRFFYRTDPFVGQAVDLHTELPLSKIRLGVPKSRNRDMAMASLRFCEKWARRTGLLHRLIEILHEYNLLGEVFVFCEDNNPDMPKEITHERINEITEEGGAEVKYYKYEDADDRAYKWMKKNYKGWTAIRILPPNKFTWSLFLSLMKRSFP